MEWKIINNTYLTLPHKHCYWAASNLIAGEYPVNIDEESSAAKIQSILDGGVTAFIDLTSDADNMRPYAAFIDNDKIKYQRFPITDHSVPESPETTKIILDAIDHYLSQGRVVYVHSSGGVGRTGTIIGCWLVRHGCPNERALETLQKLWKGGAKSAYRKSPETTMQEKYLSNGQEPSTDTESSGQVASGSKLNRAQGCLLGQLAGDSLGSLVEFETPMFIRSKYPGDVRLLANGGTFNTIAGQPTDDSEMALGLARCLVEHKTFDLEIVKQVYVDWLNSRPFDCGNTIRGGLRGMQDFNSQANGAMMRISPLAIWLAGARNQDAAELAKQDAMLTHPHPVCVQANVLFVMAIVEAIRHETKPIDLYEKILSWAESIKVEPSLMGIIIKAKDHPPADYLTHMGWVLVAFHNALWQLLHAKNLEEGVVQSVMGGGDTDTNAAICGALLGAVYGRDAIPSQWLESILSCRPERGLKNVYQPRPEIYWPMDALELAEKLLTVG